MEPIKPVRSKHWATRAYHQFLVNARSLPFAWGSHDCALFSANGIEAMTGVDIASEFRGIYTDETSAKVAIEKVTNWPTEQLKTPLPTARRSMGWWN